MAEEKASEESKENAPAKTKKSFSLLQIGLLFQVLVMMGAGGLMVKVALFAKRPDLSPHTLQERAIASVRDESADIKILALEEFSVNLPNHYMLKTKLHIEVSNAETETILKQRLAPVKAEILKILAKQAPTKTSTLLGKLALKDAIREAINDELSRHGAKTGVVREIYYMEFVLVPG